MPTVTRRHYDNAFKRKIVTMLIKSGKPVTAIAASLGIEQSILHRWKKRLEGDIARKHDKERGSLWAADIISLKNEIAEIRQNVNSLRTIVRKALSGKHSI
jgi:transposase-like protein